MDIGDALEWALENIDKSKGVVSVSDSGRNEFDMCWCCGAMSEDGPIQHGPLCQYAIARKTLEEYREEAEK